MKFQQQTFLAYRFQKAKAQFIINLVRTTYDLFSYIFIFHPFGFLSQKINMINPVLGPVL